MGFYGGLMGFYGGLMGLMGILMASGWWLSPNPLKNDFFVKVSWDDEIPNIWKNNPNVANHQQHEEV